MPATRTVEIVPTAADFFHAAAEEFIAVARAAIGAQGRFAAALSGGSTPKALYSLLAANYKEFAWNRVFLFFGDERHVPPTDAQSNYRMVKEALLAKITIPEENVFRVPAELADAAAAAAEYESQVRRFFALRPGEWPRFDLILLGMGPDGHTASLFPGFRRARRTVAPGSGQLGGEVQHAPHHIHSSGAQSRGGGDVPRQRSGQGRHAAESSRR